MVPCAEIHVPDAVDVVGIPLRLVSEGLVKVVEHSVALDVGLAVHIESEAVAEVVEHARLRIVAGTDGVDVVLLHEPEVLEHPFAAYIMACIRVGFMKVDALELHRLSVHKEKVTVDFKMAETYIEGGVLPFHAKQKLVEFRSLRSPLPHVRNNAFHHCLSSCDEPAVSKDSLSVLVEKLI